MSRLIVFDQGTAEAAKKRGGVEPELRQESIRASKFVDLVVHAQSAIAVMPGEQRGTAILMRVLRPQRLEATVPAPQGGTPSPDLPHHAVRNDGASSLAPAGFLGLSDSVDMDSEPEKPKKWWQKLLD